MFLLKNKILAIVLSLLSSQLLFAQIIAASTNWSATPNTTVIPLDFGQPISEVYFVDVFDVNYDGVDDFVVSALVDVEKQLGAGVSCCNVSPELVPKIQKIVPLLLLSNSRGQYEQIRFPDAAQTIRAWAGRFFQHDSELYFFWGRNGEISDPVDGNNGESGILFRIDRERRGKNLFEVIADTKIPTTTVSVDIVETSDGNVFVIENNYQDFSAADTYGRSYIYSFGTNKKFQLASITPTGFDPNKVNNEIKVRDLNSDGKLDVVVAAEVLFNHGTGKKQTDDIGSYILFDPLGQPKRHLLPRPYFGDDHAGHHVELLKIGEQLYLIEIGVRYEQRNNFQEPGLSIYELAQDGRPVKIDTGFSEKFTVNKFQMSGMQLTDLDADGVHEVFFQSFSDAPLYLKFNSKDRVFDLISVETSFFEKPKSGKGRAVILSADKSKSCFRIASMEDWNRADKPRLHISKKCMKP